MFLFGLSKKICAGPPGCYIVVIELMDSGAPVTINGVTKSSTSTTIFTSNSNTAAMSFPHRSTLGRLHISRWSLFLASADLAFHLALQAVVPFSVWSELCEIMGPSKSLQPALLYLDLNLNNNSALAMVMA